MSLLLTLCCKLTTFLLILETCSSRFLDISLTSSSVFNLESTKSFLYLGISSLINLSKSSVIPLIWNSYFSSISFAVSLTNFSLAEIFSSVLTSVSAKNFLYFGNTFSKRDSTCPLIPLTSVFTEERLSSLIASISEPIWARSSLRVVTKLPIESFTSSLKVTNLLSTLVSESTINFL